MVVLSWLSACNLPGMSQSENLAPASTTPGPIPANPQPVLATLTPQASLPPQTQADLTPTASPSPSDTPVPVPSLTPTFAILRGVVNVEKVSCRYGPGGMYLYLYGMLKGATQDVIGRTDSGKWLLTRARGDDKACWVKAEFMDVQGDVMGVEMVYPEKYQLPQSNQGYRPPWDVAAVRHGNQVTISWKSEALRPGDEESPTSVLYVVETWICKDGQLWFTPVGAYTPQVTVQDEPGCSLPSHGRVFFSEKHGYAGPTEITWPQP